MQRAIGSVLGVAVALAAQSAAAYEAAGPLSACADEAVRRVTAHPAGGELEDRRYLDLAARAAELEARGETGPSAWAAIQTNASHFADEYPESVYRPCLLARAAPRYQPDGVVTASLIPFVTWTLRDDEVTDVLDLSAAYGGRAQATFPRWSAAVSVAVAHATTRRAFVHDGARWPAGAKAEHATFLVEVGPSYRGPWDRMASMLRGGFSCLSRTDRPDSFCAPAFGGGLRYELTFASMPATDPERSHTLEPGAAFHFGVDYTHTLGASVMSGGSLSLTLGVGVDGRSVARVWR